MPNATDKPSRLPRLCHQCLWTRETSASTSPHILSCGLVFASPWHRDIYLSRVLYPRFQAQWLLPLTRGSGIQTGLTTCIRRRNPLYAAVGLHACAWALDGGALVRARVNLMRATALLLIGATCSTRDTASRTVRRRTTAMMLLAPRHAQEYNEGLPRRWMKGARERERDTRRVFQKYLNNHNLKVGRGKLILETFCELLNMGDGVYGYAEKRILKNVLKAFVERRKDVWKGYGYAEKRIMSDKHW
ncbi:hypothetical protein B0H16DRAFT_1686496 [Mycena metata]|uniref:Uncharacterized protein n=1 Tax=Mycena metata TaxID=1033252 RepID=A0AAD7NNM6_9AGAR|nr:hypothetical protein B0H16DRAFT_1686496 [Mycena metata]